MTDKELANMTSDELWIKRTELKMALSKKVDKATMEMIDDLLGVELWIERNEK